MPVKTHKRSHASAPAQSPDAVAAAVAAIQAKKAIAKALRSQMEARNESIQSLSKRLGTQRTAIRRILDEKNTSITLITMSKAASALGLELVVATRKLSPAELGHLAAQLPGASDADAAELEEQIVAGFYGKKTRA